PAFTLDDVTSRRSWRRRSRLRPSAPRRGAHRVRFGAQVVDAEEPVHPGGAASECAGEGGHRDAVVDECAARFGQIPSLAAADSTRPWPGSRRLRARLVQALELTDLVVGG